jgi:hypothetical protein
LQMAFDTMTTMTTEERSGAVRLFQSVEKKIRRSDEFTPEEKAAAAIVAKMISRIADGWGRAGVKRDENPSASALYFRWNRARRKLEDAKSAGVRGRHLNPLIDAAAEAEVAYRNAKEAERK